MIYVDQLHRGEKHGNKKWPYATSCYLIADTDVELEAFAQRIGLEHSWKHGDHYDLTASKRTEAIQIGAQVVTTEEIISIRRCLDAAGQ
jgi:hypothetical protein